MGVLSRLAWRLRPTAPEEGPAERFYHAYTGDLAGTPAVDAALRSQWTAHYMIYRLFLEEPVLRVPTIDLCSGSGAGSNLLARATGCSVLGVDYSREAIRYAREHNARDGLGFELIDLTSEDDLESLRVMIEAGGIEQAFFIEGIEHLAPEDSDRVIRLLLDGGIKRIRISTPYEQPGKEEEIHHITPFTPERFRAFADRWDARVFCYLKFVDVADLNGFIDSGHDEADVLKAYSTQDPALAGSYLIQIG